MKIPRAILLLGACAVTLPVAAQDWSYYRGDQGGSGFSAHQQISSDNVEGLAVAWQYRSGEAETFAEQLPRSALETTPILLPEAAGGHLVFCTAFNQVIALNPETGVERWRFDPKISLAGDRPFKCRGVSWWADSANDGELCGQRIFTATHDRRLIALDARNGKLCAGFGNKGTVKLYTDEEGFVPGDIGSVSPPVVINNTIIVGSAVVDFVRAHTPRGTVKAFDARSGALRWQFEPIPLDATAPNAGQWPVDAVAASGGANAWAPLSVDEARDLVFIPTGAPSPDYYGALRPGDNRYANSLVVLRGSTGEMVWNFQFVHHDVWDFDTPAQPMLIDLQRSGKSIPAVVQLTKQGFVFVFHRETGEPLFPILEKPVPQLAVVGEHLSPTQPVSTELPLLLNHNLNAESAWGLTPWDRGACAEKIAGLNNQGLFTALTESPTLMLPGSLGGANWGGGVFWPERQQLVVNVNTAPFVGYLKPTSSAETGEHLPPAGKTMRITMAGTPYTVVVESLLSPLGIPCSEPPWGKLMAIDLAKGEVLWQKPLGSVHEMAPLPLPFDINWGTPNLGGALMTAGNLVFIGATMDRRFRAFSAASGEILWQHTLPVDATASPMTYQRGGRQYVVIAAGGHHMYQRSMGDYIIAFALPAKSK
ncbi:pyrroloquinoline quinone-dependent dehydrogenase [Zhongshania aliphaticivorans]|uniref:pyrroloquinoline quinone-dependent dehydrogenase n=1 Tax=Zhongshania aliphaticivorans TaxID=1470434 RepID=UPI0039C8DB1B